jgi:hypothetical protein
VALRPGAGARGCNPRARRVSAGRLGSRLAGVGSVVVQAW